MKTSNTLALAFAISLASPIAAYAAEETAQPGLSRDPEDCMMGCFDTTH